MKSPKKSLFYTCHSFKLVYSFFDNGCNFRISIKSFWLIWIFCCYRIRSTFYRLASFFLLFSCRTNNFHSKNDEKIQRVCHCGYCHFCFMVYFVYVFVYGRNVGLKMKYKFLLTFYWIFSFIIKSKLRRKQKSEWVNVIRPGARAQNWYGRFQIIVVKKKSRFMLIILITKRWTKNLKNLQDIKSNIPGRI